MMSKCHAVNSGCNDFLNYLNNSTRKSEADGSCVSLNPSFVVLFLTSCSVGASHQP